jgi:SAM-dependent methyltransferase
MSQIGKNRSLVDRRKLVVLSEEDFERTDEREDRIYYEIERPGPHLDSLALKTVENIIEELVVEEDPQILDLMAGIDSHLPNSLQAKAVLGLGLNESELKKNKSLTDYVLHDLNRVPRLPFESNSFDVVLNTVSVDYLTKPFEVFEEAARVLKPGGLFLVIFSNRYFPEKVVKVWKEGSEEERILLVEEYFRRVPVLEKTRFFVSRGWPRPEGDKYSDLGIPSDPVYAIYAEHVGKPKGAKKRPELKSRTPQALSEEEFTERKRRVQNTLRCPHCDEKLNKWQVPDHPFAEWDHDFMYICFNDLCTYYLGGWNTLAQQGNHGVSYRYMFNPKNNASTSIPVPSPKALKSGIVED